MLCFVLDSVLKNFWQKHMPFYSGFGVDPMCLNFSTLIKLLKMLINGQERNVIFATVTEVLKENKILQKCF